MLFYLNNGAWQQISAETRIAEAKNMGMGRVYVSERGAPRRNSSNGIVAVRTINDMFQQLFN